jgi:hypothetical protein
MNRSLCDQLDDYLLGWLSPDEAAAFERHLSDCPACCRERALQQSIDEMLTGTEGLPDAVPAGLLDRTRCYVQTARRRRAMRWAWRLTATAIILLLGIFGSFIFHSGNAGNRDVAGLHKPAGSPGNPTSISPLSEPEQLTVSSRVRLADPESGIVLDCRTRDPKINIVWIYPSVKAVEELNK